VEDLFHGIMTTGGRRWGQEFFLRPKLLFLAGTINRNGAENTHTLNPGGEPLNKFGRAAAFSIPYRPMKFARYTFALALVAFALQQVQYDAFRPLVLPPWTGWPHGYTYAVYLSGFVMVAFAVGLVIGRDLRRVASLLGMAILVLVLVGHLPYEVTHNLNSIGPWTNTFKALAFAGGAFIIAAGAPGTPALSVAAGTAAGAHGTSSARGSDLRRIQDALITLGPAMLGLFLVVCCVEHFVYLPFVNMLVPDWLPWHTFWSVFAALALGGAGLALMFRVRVRLVGALLCIMLLLWVFMVHIPRAVADPTGLQGNEVTSVFEALAYGGIAGALAGFP
jgi:uncharacterized membrane protein